MELEIRPTGGPCGALVYGVSRVADIDEPTFARILRAVHQYSVVILRGQPQPTDAELGAFALRFGASDAMYRDDPTHPVHEGRVPGCPDLVYVSNVVDDTGQPRGVDLSKETTEELVWHHDLAFEPVTSRFGLINSVENPQTGAQTCFANNYSALETLPRELRARIEYLEAYHTREPRGAVHPVCRVNLDTGRRCLYVDPRFTQRILGVSAAESDDLLARLLDQVTDDAFVYEHTWEVGDIVVHDAIGTTHMRTAFPADQRRTMRAAAILPKAYDVPATVQATAVPV